MAISRALVQVRKQRLTRWLVIIVALGLVLAGANTVFLQLGFTALIFALALLAVMRVPMGRAVNSPLLWIPRLLAAFGLLCLLQVVLLPCDWLAAIAPLSVENFARLALVSDQPCRASISLTRENTLLTALWWFALAAWAWMLIVVTHGNTQRTNRLMLALLAIAVFEAVYGLLMLQSGLDLGAYFAAKTAYMNDATGTLVNRNHYAALMYMASALTFPAILSRTEGYARGQLHNIFQWLTSSKVLIRMALVIFAIAAVNSHSRMGSVALAAGLATCCTLGLLGSLWPSKKTQLGSSRYMLFLTASILLIDLVVVSQWFGLEKVVNRIEATNVNTESRGDVVEDILQSPWPKDAMIAGTGAGSFELLYRQYESQARWLRFDYAHNDWLQFWLEYGLAGAILLTLGLGLFIRSIRGLAMPKVIAASALLAMLATHALVDFALRMPAVGLYVVAVFTVLLSYSRTSRSVSARTKRGLIE